MKFILSVVSLMAVALTPVAAAPEGILEVRQDSGCYPFEDPDCCIDYAVCQCANGWFYEYNEAEGGCNPPWGVLSENGEGGLPGFCC
ncbi:hypothetical protein F5Y16DRAFT_1285 [Xylariaceae sp. FL0255]|nr:hypothetical protein F5Y16DRAFT_1285 [Xylariaceae sp. FL0255]